jgi:hypothetical protein
MGLSWLETQKPDMSGFINHSVYHTTFFIRHATGFPVSGKASPVPLKIIDGPLPLSAGYEAQFGIMAPVGGRFSASIWVTSHKISPLPASTSIKCPRSLRHPDCRVKSI